MANTGTDIFGYNRSPKPEAVFSNSEAYLKFGQAQSKTKETDVNSLLGALIQNWRLDYTNNIAEIFELGSDAIYWVRGRPTGAGSIARILGFKKVKLFPDDAWNVCNGGTTMEIEAKPGLCTKDTTGTKVTISLSGVVVTNIGFDATVGDTRINENIAFRFATLSLVEPETNAK